MGSSPTSGNSEDLSQYDPGCWTGRKTPTLTFVSNAILFNIDELNVIVYFVFFIKALEQVVTLRNQTPLEFTIKNSHSTAKVHIVQINWFHYYSTKCCTTYHDKIMIFIYFQHNDLDKT